MLLVRADSNCNANITKYIHIQMLFIEIFKKNDENFTKYYIKYNVSPRIEDCRDILFLLFSIDMQCCYKMQINYILADIISEFYFVLY